MFIIIYIKILKISQVCQKIHFRDQQEIAYLATKYKIKAKY